MMDVGKSIDKASSSFDKAMARLQNGRGNLIRRAEQMRALGINHAKKIDSNLILHENENVSSNAEVIEEREVVEN